MEQQRLNPTIAYILSTLGLLCCCMLGSGIIPSAIAYFMAKNNLKRAENDIDNYDPSSLKAMNVAKIIALVVVVINLLMVIRVIYAISTVGWDEMYNQFMESYQEALKAQGQ